MNCDYDELISVENLFRSWRMYKNGKSRKLDVMEFERHLEDNLFTLHQRLQEENYSHDGYVYFRIADPKKRDIYKVAVRDRVVHQAVYKYLCKIYEPFFIEYSFSSRERKGAHKAVMALKALSSATRRKEKICWAVKCDVRKYFENINHKILLDILREEVRDGKIFNLLEIIVRSFNSEIGKGVPLGNITSQIFANIYLNELDKFVEGGLGLKNRYVRYNDDFIILGNDAEKLLENAKKIKKFLSEKLLLDLPVEKTVFRKLEWGIDFCGCIILPNAVLLRNKTKGRMLKKIEMVSKKFELGKISSQELQKTLDSYFGMLSHCRSYNLRVKIKNRYFRL